MKLRNVLNTKTPKSPLQKKDHHPLESVIANGYPFHIYYG